MSEVDQKTGLKPVKKRRLMRWLVLPLLALSLLLVVLLGWVLSTESGLQAGAYFARGVLPSGMEFDAVSGRLIGPLEVNGLTLATEAAEVSVQRLELDWQPSKLFGLIVRVDSVEASGVNVRLLKTTPQEPSEAFRMPEQMAAPVGLMLKRIRVVDLRILQQDSEFVVQEVSASASWIDTQIELSRLQVVADMADITTTAKLDAKGDYPLSATLTHTLRVDKLTPVVGTLAVSQSLRHPELDWELAAPWSTKLVAKVGDLVSTPTVSAELTFAPSTLADLGTDFPPYNAGLTLNAKGGVETLMVNGSVQLAGADFPTLSAELAAQVAPTLIELKSLVLSIADQPHPLVVRGRVDLESAPSIDLTASWKELQVPSQVPPLRIEAGSLQVLGPLDFYRVKGSTRVDYSGFETPITLAGSGNQTHFVLDSLSAVLGQKSRRTMTAAKDGTLPAKAQIVILDNSLITDASAPAKGTLEVSGRADFTENVQLAVKVSGKNIDPSLYLAELPGTLNVQSAMQLAQLENGAFNVDVSRLSVDGELAGETVNVTGAGSWIDGKGAVENLDTRWGDYVLAANGDIGAKSNLDWRLRVPDLAQAGRLLGETWRGSVSGKGKIRGSLTSPRIVADAQAKDVFVAGAQLKSLVLKMDAAVEGALNADLTVTDAQMSGETVDAVEFKLTGTALEHGVSVAIESPRADLSLDARGSLNSQQQWRFNLSALELLHPDLDVNRADHRWALSAPVSGVVSADILELQKLCLAHEVPAGGGSLCAQANVSEASTSASVALDSLLLSNLNGLLPVDVQIVGTLDGDAQWNGELAATRGQFDLSGVGVRVRREDEALRKQKDLRKQDYERSIETGGWLDVARFAPGRIAIQPEPGKFGLSVQMPTLESAQDGLFADVTVTSDEAVASANWPMQADIKMSFPDLAWIAAFVEPLTSMTGGFNSNVTLSGTVGAPLIEGSSDLNLPAVKLDELGLSLTDTRFRLLGTQQGLELKGTTHSGSGTMDLSSTVNWADGLDVSGTMVGKEFVVSDTPQARVSVSPDLRVSYAKERLTLRGDVAIPLADIRLDKVPTGAVSASKDQRFVTEEGAAQPLATDIRIRLLLGDEVRFKGLGLDAKFAGALAIRDASNQPTTATGEIDIVEGAYKAYGQDLTINDGKVIFVGGPIEEPGLDVRAVRQATPEVSVGVHVRGSLRSPVLNVFSTPALPQSEQLSYLVLGKSLSSSSASENSLLQQAAMAVGVQGGELFTDRIGKSLGVDSIGIESAPGSSNAQAALVVGKYLSPKLYVSYGYGLFEPISTLRLEYQLGRLWRVVTESTNNATGGDFIWVHER